MKILKFSMLDQGRPGHNHPGELEASVLNHKSDSKDFQQSHELTSCQMARRMVFQAKHK